jgi:hypothetical protein
MTAPKFEDVEVRPLKRVFMNGRMIGPMETAKTYRFTGDELPANTILADEPVPPEPPVTSADTKPADARAAMRKKAKGITGSADME